MQRSSLAFLELVCDVSRGSKMFHISLSPDTLSRPSWGILRSSQARWNSELFHWVVGFFPAWFHFKRKCRGMQPGSILISCPNHVTHICKLPWLGQQHIPKPGGAILLSGRWPGLQTWRCSLFPIYTCWRSGQCHLHKADMNCWGFQDVQNHQTHVDLMRKPTDIRYHI